jgi:hypothetical protein
VHYHGPGGLNGRVRNGNGCGPAGVVAGDPAGGRSSPLGRISIGPAVGRTRFGSGQGQAQAQPKPFTHTGESVGTLQRPTVSVPVIAWDPLRIGPVECCAVAVQSHAEGWVPRRALGVCEDAIGPAEGASRGGQATWLLGPVG